MDNTKSRIPVRTSLGKSKRSSLAPSNPPLQTPKPEKKPKKQEIFENETQSNESEINHKKAYAVIASESVKSLSELQDENEELRRSINEGLMLISDCQSIFTTVQSKSKNFFDIFINNISNKNQEIESKMQEVERISTISQKVNSLVSLMQQKCKDLEKKQSEKLSNEREIIENFEKLKNEKESILISLTEKESEILRIKQHLDTANNENKEMEKQKIEISKENEELKNKIEELTNQANEQESKEIEELKLKVQEMSQENNELNEKIAQIEAENEQRNNENNELFKKIEEISLENQNTKSENESLKARIEEVTARGDSSRNNEIEELQRKLGKLLFEKQNIEEENALLKKKIANYTSENQNSGEIERLKGKITEMVIENQNINNENEELKKENEELRSRIQKGDKSNDEIKKLNSQIAQMIIENHNNSEEMNKKIEEITKENEELAQQLKIKEDEDHKNNVNVAEYIQLQTQINSLEEQNQKYQEKIKKLDEEMTKKNAEILSYQTQLETTNNENDEIIQNLKKQLKGSAEEMQKLSDQIQQLDDFAKSKQITESERERLKSLEIEVAEYKQKFEEVKGLHLTELTLKNDDLMKKNETISKQNNELMKKVSIISDYEEQISSLNDTCKQLSEDLEKEKQTNKDLQAENDKASQELDVWKIKATRKEYDEELFNSKEKEINDLSSRLESLTSEVDKTKKENEEISMENTLLVKRQNDSDKRCKELEEKLRDLDNSTRLEREDLQQQLIDYDKMKEDLDKANKLVISATEDRTKAENALQDAHGEIDLLKKKIKSNDKEKQLQIEINDLKMQLVDAKSMVETYKKINELISAKADQANQTLADSLALEPSTPIPMKTSTAVSPFKQLKDPMTPSKAIKSINEKHEQEVDVLRGMLNENQTEISKLREQIKDSNTSSTYWEIQNLKDKNHELEEKLVQASSKINELNEKVVEMSKKCEESASRAFKSISAELSLRSELVSMQAKVDKVTTLLKKRGINLDMIEVPRINRNEMEKAASSILEGFNSRFNTLVDNFTSSTMKKLVECESEVRKLSATIVLMQKKPVNSSPSLSSPRIARTSRNPLEMLDPHLFT